MNDLANKVTIRRQMDRWTRSHRWHVYETKAQRMIEGEMTGEQAVAALLVGSPLFAPRSIEFASLDDAAYSCRSSRAAADHTFLWCRESC